LGKSARYISSSRALNIITFSLQFVQWCVTSPVV
jgi:hypothetical protein